LRWSQYAGLFDVWFIEITMSLGASAIAFISSERVGPARHRIIDRGLLSASEATPFSQSSRLPEFSTPQRRRLYVIEVCSEEMRCKRKGRKNRVSKDGYLVSVQIPPFLLLFNSTSGKYQFPFFTCLPLEKKGFFCASLLKMNLGINLFGF